MLVYVRDLDPVRTHGFCRLEILLIFLKVRIQNPADFVWIFDRWIDLLRYHISSANHLELSTAFLFALRTRPDLDLLSERLLVH